MVSPLALVLVALQAPAQAPAAAPLPQPIARVDVKPADSALRVGDSLRLSAVAYDSAGRAMDTVRIRWITSGGRFEGSVDSTGLVRAGSTGVLNVSAGVLNVSAIAIPTGRPGRPTIGIAHITVLPLPAAKVVLSPQPLRLLAGIAITVAAAPYAANDDRRYDPVKWSSNRPSVLEVNAVGRLLAHAPGRATVSAAAGGANASWTVTVVPNAVVRIGLAPADTAVRTGDVVALWRHGHYVFVGDEVFAARAPGGTQGVANLGRAFGRLHVIDIADLAHPREVAWFEPEDGGSHNVWIAGDTLYLGDYQGGLRVLDISGELKGDLGAEGREYAHVHTGDDAGIVKNTANAWGAIYRDGLIYVPDINSGLWIVRVEPRPTAVP